jgi:hypothetical protein
MPVAAEPRFQANLTQADFRKLFWWLLAIDLFLFLAYLLIFVFAPHFPWGPLDHWFDLDEDMSIPSWFASLQYVFVTLVFFFSARQVWPGAQISRRFLAIACAVMAFLGLDEAVGIHEQFSEAMKKLNLTGLKFLAFAGSHGLWISIYAVLGLLVFLLIYRDLLALWKYYRFETLGLVFGALLLGLGEAGLEVISYLFLRTSAAGPLYNLEVAFEELFALAGMSLILVLALRLSAKLQTPAKP